MMWYTIPLYISAAVTIGFFCYAMFDSQKTEEKKKLQEEKLEMQEAINLLPDDKFEDSKIDKEKLL